MVTDNRDNWSFEKEIVFESGAVVKVTIGYSNVRPFDSINVISGLNILTGQVTEKVESLKKMSE